MIMVIDNYDSFTYNLVQMIEMFGETVVVIRNDRIDIKGVLELTPSGILISPGPGGPDSAGISVALIKALYSWVPILGVCLGHQAIGRAFGAKIKSASAIMHGKTSLIYHDGNGIYQGVSNPFVATRYHSLVIDESSLPECINVSAYSDNGEVMGIRHKDYPVEGIQFHPESILTEVGSDLMKNFLNLIKRKV